MNLSLTIKNSGAAFDDEPRAEVARILRDVADFLDNGGSIPQGEAMILRDINGNRCGEARHTVEKLEMTADESELACALEWAFRHAYHRRGKACEAFHELTGWGWSQSGDVVRFTRSHAEEEGED